MCNIYIDCHFWQLSPSPRWIRDIQSEDHYIRAYMPPTSYRYSILPSDVTAKPAQLSCWWKWRHVKAMDGVNAGRQNKEVLKFPPQSKRHSHKECIIIRTGDNYCKYPELWNIQLPHATCIGPYRLLPYIMPSPVCTEQNYNSISPSHSLPNEGEEYPFEKIPLGDTLRLFVANWQHAKAILNSFSWYP